MYQFIAPGQHITLSGASFRLLVLVFVWSTVWKAVALWKASRNNQLGWFILLLIVNTLGLLEIIYIFFLQPKPDADKPDKK